LPKKKKNFDGTVPKVAKHLFERPGPANFQISIRVESRRVVVTAVESVTAPTSRDMRYSHPTLDLSGRGLMTERTHSNFSLSLLSASWMMECRNAPGSASAAARFLDRGRLKAPLALTPLSP
jgi:hypothetical protein